MVTGEQTLVSGQMPLAARMRPKRIEDIIGQISILRPGSPLMSLASGEDRPGALTSVILFGPPGTGKTTIAQAIAASAGRRFVELSAVTAGVKDVRDVIERARLDNDTYGKKTVLFLDEIHRFSKSQQDSLLPAVEHGVVVLVAATTENPSFSVISPLLSRSLLIELQSLTEAEILEVLRRALVAEQGLASKFSISADVLGEITRMSGGDARKALTILEAAASASSSNSQPTEAKSAQIKKTQKTDALSSQIEITREAVELATDRVFVAYDKSGDQHYDVISAFIKSIRGSDADAAVHYLARMLEGGEDPRFIARRLIILASEDVGLADPNATQVAVAAFNAVALVGMPEGRIPLANATIYLALAPKSNSSYLAINEAIDDVRNISLGKIPTPLRSSNYVGAKKRGLGQGYLYPHDDTRAVVEQQYLSRELLSKTYYRPKAVGHERELGERWSRLRTIIRAFKSTK